MQDSFSDAGPVGGSFVHNGTTYQINPNVLSGRSMRAIRRVVADINRRDMAQLLSQGSLPAAAVQQVCQHYKVESQIGFGDIVRAVQLPEVVASIIEIGCDAVDSYDHAMQLVDEYPNFAELMGIVIQACGLDTLKNSKAPASDEQTPGVSESVPASVPTPTPIPRTLQPPRPATS